MTLLRALFRGLVLASVMSASVFAQAQGLEVQPDARVLCLVSPLQKGMRPQFPTSELGKDGGGTVRIAMTFDVPDASPAVQVTYNSAGKPFEESVVRFVSEYRLPCLPPGQRLNAIQEFQFTLQRVLGGAASAEDRSLPAGCLEATKAWRVPDYPRRRQRSANVLVEFSFVSPDSPPGVKILYDGGEPAMGRAIEEVAKDFRLPCAQPGSPIVALQQYGFKLEGDSVSKLVPELSLVDMLSILKPATRKDIRFDFRTMGCPFSVEVGPRLPYAPNSVKEVGPPVAHRTSFIQWLRYRATFDIPAHQMPTIFGEPTTIQVPCAVLDLT